MSLVAIPILGEIDQTRERVLNVDGSGDLVAADSVTVILDDTTTTETTLADFRQVQGTDSGRFEAGDR